MGKVNTQQLASRLIHAVARINDALVPAEVALAQAELGGMCKAANAIGFGHTGDHIEMLARQAYRDNPPSGTRRWERRAADRLAAELDVAFTG